MFLELSGDIDPEIAKTPENDCNKIWASVLFEHAKSHTDIQTLLQA